MKEDRPAFFSSFILHPSSLPSFDLDIWKPLGLERFLERLCVELALVFQAKPQLTGLEVHLNRALFYPR